jgi:hypothetical protein
MKGEIPTLPPHAFMEHRGTTLPFAASQFLFPPCNYNSHLFYVITVKLLNYKYKLCSTLLYNQLPPSVTTLFIKVNIQLHNLFSNTPSSEKTT